MDDTDRMDEILIKFNAKTYSDTVAINAGDQRILAACTSSFYEFIEADPISPYVIPSKSE